MYLFAFWVVKRCASLLYKSYYYHYSNVVFFPLTDFHFQSLVYFQSLKNHCNF